jgi:hypothetical protein
MTTNQGFEEIEEEFSFTGRLRAKRGKRIVNEDILAVMEKVNQIAFDEATPKEEQLVRFSTQLIEQAQGLNSLIESLIMNLQSKIQTVIVRA